MEDIDIENLNFDVYNREVYKDQGQISKSYQNDSRYVDIQKKYKSEIDKFVENYNKNRAAQNEMKEENLERIKKRKY